MNRVNVLFYVILVVLTQVLVGCVEQAEEDGAGDLSAPLTSLGETFEAVDLGLSVKWASFNVGATSVYDYGCHFAWAELEPKSLYSWESYKYGDGSVESVTKYFQDEESPAKTLLRLEPIDDVAHVLLGGSWRLPTYEEMYELYDSCKCQWKWVEVEGMRGYNVVGPNGNSIFMPASGYREGGDLRIQGDAGFYWTSDCRFDMPSTAYQVYFYSDFHSMHCRGYRHVGQSVRPVTE